MVEELWRRGVAYANLWGPGQPWHGNTVTVRMDADADEQIEEKILEWLHWRPTYETREVIRAHQRNHPRY